MASVLQVAEPGFTRHALCWVTPLGLVERQGGIPFGRSVDNDTMTALTGCAPVFLHQK